MKILLANPRGFCAGVNMAIECLDDAIRRVGPNIYVYHEIVHNRYVVDRFTQQGVTFVDTIEEVPEGSILLFSAHGVSPEIRNRAKQRRLQTVDATCPLVTKVHLEAIRYARNNFHIILIGHQGHDEVIGTMGEAPQSITLVETAEEVDALTFEENDKLAYLTQTTLSVVEAQAVISTLKRRYPGIQSPPKEDICYATTNRQDAVEALVKQADVLIVLGSQNSSNSRRLMEIGAQRGVSSRLVDGAEDLRAAWFENAETVVVTAGASAPDIVVQECIAYLTEHFDATLSEETLREENVHFNLPRDLQQLTALPEPSDADAVKNL
ncbi:MAG: 4-hydroxy-3-methylbut-2-enyl diphosphate reductase [Fuerstiella sp.]|nr:4-hydroxy-3-methylbut-2-enyl diphosphate reductase [Fuerstiella sp.]